MSSPLEQTKALATHVNAALDNFRGVASFLPTSPWAARSIACLIEPQCDSIVEYGFGTGNVTRELLLRLAPEGQLVGIEVERRFVPHLNAIGDSRFRPLVGSVLDALPRLDLEFPDGLQAVVSGIPFGFLSPSSREQIVRLTRERLRNGGKFVVYQHSRLLMPLLKKYFGKVDTRFEPRNLLPYFIMVGEA